MKTTIINGHKETDKVMKIMDICKKYIPEFYNSKNYKYNIIHTICSNPKYHDDFIHFVIYAENPRSGMDDIDIRITLMHDIGGLMKKEECFLPRVSGYAPKTKQL
jgi:hypothetical protein